MFGREPVGDRNHRTSRLHGQNGGQPVMGIERTVHPSSTMKEQHHRQYLAGHRMVEPRRQ